MKAQCAHPDCQRTAARRQWCHAHYRRWLHHGTTKLIGREYSCKPPCHCGRPHKAHGLCEMHYGHWYYRKFVKPKLEIRA